jgi:hypothetical protein
MSSIASRQERRARLEFDMARMIFGCWMDASFCCRTWQEKASEGAPERGEKVGGGGGVPLTVGDESDRGHLQTHGSSSRDCHVLEASRAKGKRERIEESLGYL